MTGQELTPTTRDPWNVQQTDQIKPFIPSGFASIYSFAELISASNMAPKDMKTPEQISVAIFHGMEVGMTPMAALQSIAVINGRPSIWGDGALALIRASGQLDDIEEFYEGEFLGPDGKPNPNYKAICRITRKGAKRPVVSEFSIGDAMMANLWTKAGPWKEYPKRMLKMRARAFAIRDEFTDIMRGLGIAEEVEDYNMRDITPTNEDPPAPAGDDKPKRGRPRKEAPTSNQYQVEHKTGEVTEAEVIDASTGEVTTETGSDDPPAPAGTKKASGFFPGNDESTEDKVEETKPVAEKKAAPRVLEEVKKPASDEDPEHATMMAELLEAASTNKPLREYLAYLDDYMAKAGTLEQMRKMWQEKKPFDKPVKAEQDAIFRLRDYHKNRATAADEAATGGGEDPPAPGGGPVFDYPDFLHNLDVELGKHKTPDDVNRVYAEWTELPLKEGAITGEQEENDLKPLWAGHLERADFGG